MKNAQPFMLILQRIKIVKTKFRYTPLVISGNSLRFPEFKTLKVSLHSVSSAMGRLDSLLHVT